jgi:hypothetical protein
MRELNTVNVGIKILTIRLGIFPATRRVHDEYVLNTNKPTPIFIRTADFLGKYNIDSRKIKTTPTHSSIWREYQDAGFYFV